MLTKFQVHVVCTLQSVYTLLIPYQAYVSHVTNSEFHVAQQLTELGTWKHTFHFMSVVVRKCCHVLLSFFASEHG